VETLFGNSCVTGKSFVRYLMFSGICIHIRNGLTYTFKRDLEVKNMLLKKNFIHGNEVSTNKELKRGRKNRLNWVQIWFAYG